MYPIPYQDAMRALPQVNHTGDIEHPVSAARLQWSRAGDTNLFLKTPKNMSPKSLRGPVLA